MFVSLVNCNFRKGLRSVKWLGAYKARNISAAKIPILYGDVASPPVRFVMMTASLLNINVKFHNIDLFKAENKTRSYTKITPLQKVPVLTIGEHVIRDSHAIALYFCNIGSNQDLYPEDNLLRAKVDELLFYNSGILFPIDSAIYTEFFAGVWPVDEMKVNKWYSALDYLEMRLSEQIMLTGSKVRLCDLCCATTISSIQILLPLQERHKHIGVWLKRLKLLSCFQINELGLQRLEYFATKKRQLS